MNNNPILLNAPHGDLTPLHGAAAVIGAGFNLWNNWDKIDSFSEGLAYAGNGALAGVVSIGNPVAAGAILAGGNKVIQAINGDFTLDDLDSFDDLAGTALDVGLDFVGGYGIGDLTKGLEALIVNGTKVIWTIVPQVNGTTLLWNHAPSTIASGGSKVAASLVDDVVKAGADDIVNAGTKAVSSGSKLASNSARLNSHLSQLEKYGKAGQKTLENGRIRYYGEITKANKPGEMIGRRVVREWDPITNNKRLWMETLDNAGRIRQVRPQFGSVKGKHYLFDSAGKLIGVWL